MSPPALSPPTSAALTSASDAADQSLQDRVGGAGQAAGGRPRAHGRWRGHRVRAVPGTRVEMLLLRHLSSTLSSSS